MRNIIITLITIISTNILSAQEHLSFKGIPLEGNITAFCQKLEEKGYCLIGRDSNTYLLNGNFTGKDAIIGVTTTDNGENVYGVTVIFDSTKEWNTLVKTYNYYKELYHKKYGKLSFTKESNTASVPSNVFLMDNLCQGIAEYYSNWVTTGGEITLSINKSPTKDYEGVVMITYRDTLNSETKFQSDLEDI